MKINIFNNVINPHLNCHRFNSIVEGYRRLEKSFNFIEITANAESCIKYRESPRPGPARQPGGDLSQRMHAPSLPGFLINISKPLRPKANNFPADTCPVPS